ncbi:ParB/RepB/Spo0J family partition protein [Curvivirga aplysinae]|uniref:ParB/RepB/Spo0J family partition protein n=1 Tax=Curvivirga aplysinae TaxID=2529852 RepID=UPI0012BD5243|nr:ParB/RepB/Spo0J family partition protein [Curvivirga aplysinae]MTI09308.1 ParB/RepB/Spo0J family partition protein [Curvivirga aplysinae]
MIAAKKSNLGRGLSALLGDETAFEETLPAEVERASKPVPVEFLKPNPDQPRKRFEDGAIDSLVKSIEEKGILQPILVRRHPQETNSYEIVAGERRWRAAQRAKLHEVPVIIKDLSDADTLEFALIENIHREDLTPLEEAEGYQRLMDEFGHTQEALSKTVSKSRSHIANTLRLLNLSDEIKSMIDDGLLSAGHGRCLVGVANAEEIAHIVIEKGLNVRQTEQLVKQGKTASADPMKKIKKQLTRDPNVSALEDSLTNNLGMKVKIATKSEETGKLTIEYDNLDQLDEVISRLSSTGLDLPTEGNVVEM